MKYTLNVNGVRMESEDKGAITVMAIDSIMAEVNKQSQHESIDTLLNGPTTTDLGGKKPFTCSHCKGQYMSKIKQTICTRCRMKGKKAKKNTP